MPRARPGLIVVVSSIGDIGGMLRHSLYAHDDDRDATRPGSDVSGGGALLPTAAREVRLDEVIRALRTTGHLMGYNATAAAWQGVGHAATGKIMLDAAE